MIKIYPESEQNDVFWALMGRYFADRRYAKEMGGWQFYTEPNAVWFLIFDQDDLAGFCAAFFRKTHVFWDNFYIFPAFRGRGLSRQLINARLVYCRAQTNKPIKSITDNPLQVKNYERINMQRQGQRGRYTRFILTAGHDSDAGVDTAGVSGA